MHLDHTRELRRVTHQKCHSQRLPPIPSPDRDNAAGGGARLARSASSQLLVQASNRQGITDFLGLQKSPWDSSRHRPQIIGILSKAPKASPSRVGHCTSVPGVPTDIRSRHDAVPVPKLGKVEIRSSRRRRVSQSCRTRRRGRLAAMRTRGKPWHHFPDRARWLRAGEWLLDDAVRLAELNVHRLCLTALSPVSTRMAFWGGGVCQALHASEAQGEPSSWSSSAAFDLPALKPRLKRNSVAASLAADLTRHDEALDLPLTLMMQRRATHDALALQQAPTT